MIWLMMGVLFFKQKTAYEMRISDWSSDVCSSDLLEDGQTRAFSFANPPHDNALIELHVRLIPGGRFTTHVFNAMQVGDRIVFEAPLGRFTLHAGSRDRTRVVTGKSVSVRVDLGGRRILKTTNNAEPSTHFTPHHP